MGQHTLALRTPMGAPSGRGPGVVCVVGRLIDGWMGGCVCALWVGEWVRVCVRALWAGGGGAVRQLHLWVGGGRSWGGVRGG